MLRWLTITPDGRQLVVTRDRDGWIVACGETTTPPRARLDSALVEAMLVDDDFAAHSLPLESAAWARKVADRIEREARGPNSRPR